MTQGPPNPMLTLLFYIEAVAEEALERAERIKHDAAPHVVRELRRIHRELHILYETVAAAEVSAETWVEPPRRSLFADDDFSGVADDAKPEDFNDEGPAGDGST
jgi:hypothetical protein